ncbi:hypothetical protein D0868_00541 [Hortaea werneckii]|uniref:C2H2-type domain-containing protein n=1 Tax=Hortaea werneckii TaxID=91943 RepID=A0A3M6ZLN3_HORWE|nr:hypothetical protein D0868_00541 [Hortaea werneckii]
MAGLGNQQGENGQSSEDESWIDEYGLSLDKFSGIPNTLIPDSGLLQSPATPIHDTARARLCPSNLTALTGGAFSAETTPKEPTEPLPGVVPAPQPPLAEKEGYFAPFAHGRYADTQTPRKVPDMVMAELVERFSKWEGGWYKCIDDKHKKRYEFSTLSDLKKHLRSHMPYEHLPHHCFQDGCGRRFLFSKDLKKHWNAHAGSSVKCPHCNKNMSRSDNLARHIRTQHPDIHVAEVIEGLHESPGQGLTLPELLSAAHDGKASKGRRSKKPRMETLDETDDESNIDPILRAAQHTAGALTARSVASVHSRKDTPSSSDVPTSARTKEGNKKHLRRQETENSSSDSEPSQSTKSTRSRKLRTINCATLTAPSSVGSGSSERKHFDRGSDTVARESAMSRTTVGIALDGT